MGGVVIGARVPIMLPSRSDPPEARLASLPNANEHRLDQPAFERLRYTLHHMAFARYCIACSTDA